MFQVLFLQSNSGNDLGHLFMCCLLIFIDYMKSVYDANLFYIVNKYSAAKDHVIYNILFLEEATEETESRTLWSHLHKTLTVH